MEESKRHSVHCKHKTYMYDYGRQYTVHTYVVYMYVAQSSTVPLIDHQLAEVAAINTVMYILCIFENLALFCEA